MNKKQVSLLLPDIRSGFNVGSFFRTADGLGVDKIYLTGFTPYPPHAAISKTALGADEFVDWEYHLEAVELIKKLKMENFEIVALELTKNAISIKSYKPQNEKVCLILGNEISGISQELLDMADKTLKIPMQGQKESLNVSIAGSIALWELLRK